MAIDYDKLINLEFPEVEKAYTLQDAMLYALGVGLGMDPLDEAQLRFVYEKELHALPTMAAVLGHAGFWAKDTGTGLDWVRILHGEQSLEFHGTLPPEGVIRSKTRITQIIDKGADKGALLFLEREGVDASGGRSLFTARQTIFARGDGGFGGPKVSAPPPHPLPDRPPEEVCDLPTLPQAALIYRLSGDDNPLHADPAVAAEAGYKAPILHGLCTFGVAGHALLKTYCGYDPARLKSIQARFSAPVYPGETLRTEMWRDGPVVSFRTRAVERDLVVLNNGRAKVGT